MPTALNSLYGSGHVNATRTRECVAMPGVRNQVVMTPQSVVDGLLAFWPEGIGYDAAHAHGSLVNAESHTSTRGLLDPWPHRTYCNPPFGTSLFDPEHEAWSYIAELTIRERAKTAKKTPKFPKGLPLKKAGLKDWLLHSLQQSQGETVMLVPNRTNRRWLRHWRSYCDELIELDPLAFHGQKQAFPAPLVLGLVVEAELSFCPDDYDIEQRCIDFRNAFAHLGDPA